VVSQQMRSRSAWKRSAIRQKIPHWPASLCVSRQSKAQVRYFRGSASASGQETRSSLQRSWRASFESSAQGRLATIAQSASLWGGATAPRPRTAMTKPDRATRLRVASVVRRGWGLILVMWLDQVSWPAVPEQQSSVLPSAGAVLGRLRPQAVGATRIHMWVKRRPHNYSQKTYPRKGGSVGSRGGMLLFPGIVVPCIRRKGGTDHHPGRCGLIHMGLEAVPPDMELFA
jgi:hypothetical protein